MSDIDDAFDSLMGELESSKKEAKTSALSKRKKKLEAERQRIIAERELYRPDAIVLITVHTTCESCGTVHKHPNKNLVVRKGRDLLRIEHWSLELDALPRELHSYNDTIFRCGECFLTGSISDLILEKQKENAKKR